MSSQENIFKQWRYTFKSVILSIGLVYSSLAAAAVNATFVSMTTVSKSVQSSVSGLATVFVDVAIISGLGFVTASFFKFHQHKQNPQQVQMTQGVSLLLIGCGLTLIPLLIPTASVSVLGTAAKKTAQIGGTDIHHLIGSS